KQRSRAMPHVAVRATLGYTRHHRQHRLLAIECLDLALLIDAKDDGSVGRGKVQTDNIAHFVDEQRIVRGGCKPNAAHIGRIVWWEKPVSAAIERIDQCVASTGVVRNVRSITAAT